MKFFGSFSLLLLLSLLSCFDCYAIKCSFFVARQENNVYTGQYQIGCDAQFTSYEGEFFNHYAINFDSDLNAVKALDFSKEENVSNLVEKRNQKFSPYFTHLSANKLTEYVVFRGHRSSTIPNGLGSQFPNLKHFTFISGVLSTLSRDDLKQFPEAVTFDFQSNILEYLEQDLFADNKQLVSVELLDNKIMEVSPNIGLFGMKKLFYINMVRNRCINEIFYCKDCKDDELAKSLKEFDAKLTNNCAGMEKMRSNAVVTSEAIKTVQSFVDEQAKSINEVKAHMSQTDQGLEKMNSGLTALEGKLNDHAGNLNKMTAQMTQMSGNLMKVQDSVEKFSKVIDRVYNLIYIVVGEKTKKKA